MYSFDVAHVMKARAASCCFDVAGTARFQLHSQVGPPVKSPVGMGAKPTRSATWLCFGSYSSPAATVASIQRPQRPPANNARFSLKPLEVAPGGPNWRSPSLYHPMARRHSGVSILVRHWLS